MVLVSSVSNNVVSILSLLQLETDHLKIAHVYFVDWDHVRARRRQVNVTVMGIGANATETSDIVYRCINQLLGGQLQRSNY